jgi:hypothetical protein
MVQAFVLHTHNNKINAIQRLLEDADKYTIMNIYMQHNHIKSICCCH